MTVRELIEELKKYPEHAMVFVPQVLGDKRYITYLTTALMLTDKLPTETDCESSVLLV